VSEPLRFEKHSAAYATTAKHRFVVGLDDRSAVVEVLVLKLSFSILYASTALKFLVVWLALLQLSLIRRVCFNTVRGMSAYLCCSTRG
jgi:hypothetical protein